MFLIKIMPTLAGIICLIISLVDTYFYGILALFSDSTGSKFPIIIMILIMTVLTLICTMFLIVSLQRYLYTMFLIVSLQSYLYYRLLTGLRLSHKEANILLLGDGASKITLLHMLKDKVPRGLPLQHPVSVEFRTERIKFKVFDLGGHQNARRVWRDYPFKVDAVVYLVDAYYREEFEEFRRELEALLTDESLLNVPFLILGYDIELRPRKGSELIPDNNIDPNVRAFIRSDYLRRRSRNMRYCYSESLLGHYLGLTGVTTGQGTIDVVNTNVRPIELFMCSVYDEGFKWLSQYIN